MRKTLYSSHLGIEQLCDAAGRHLRSDNDDNINADEKQEVGRGVRNSKVIYSGANMPNTLSDGGRRRGDGSSSAIAASCLEDSPLPTWLLD
jgi:hypothetical protein